MKYLNKTKVGIMKKIAIVVLLITPLFGFSQSIFEKYEDMEEVSTVVVTKKAFELMAKISGDSPEAKEYKEMVMGLNNLTVFSTEDESIANKMKVDIAKFLKSTKLSELVRVKDKEANVRIYVKEGRDKDHVSELFMFISSLKDLKIDERSPKAVFVSLTGDIDLNRISELTTKMNIPGGDHLKKTKQ